MRKYKVGDYVLVNERHWSGSAVRTPTFSLLSKHNWFEQYRAVSDVLKALHIE